MGGAGSGSWHRWDRKDVVEGHRAIDVGYLNRNGMLRPGYRGTVSWRQGEQRAAQIAIWVEEGQVMLDYRHRAGASGEWQNVRYGVPLTWTYCNLGGGRPWFVCPGVVSGRRCDRRVAKLYGAGKYFLCRHCHDLTYRSRQVPYRLGPSNKAERILRRLGGSMSTAEAFPERPKGMHHETYRRLKWEYEEATREDLWAFSTFLRGRTRA